MPRSDLERLLTLTLALEDALSRDDFDGADALFRERDTALEKTICTGIKASDRPMVIRIQESERRVLCLLRSGVSETAERMRDHRRGTTARRTYRTADRGNLVANG